MTTSAYGNVLTVMAFLGLAGSGACWLNLPRFFLPMLILTGCLNVAMLTVGASPVLDSVRGERAIGDWLYFDSMDLSEDDANRIYGFLDTNQKTELMEQFCQPEVASFLSTPTMGSVRNIGRCWKGLEITSVRKRFLDSPKS